MLAGVTTDGPAGQITAALTLIKMNVSPVMVIRLPFGGDNHADPDLARFEVPQTESGVQQIGALMAQLQSAGLEDRVTFAMLNVFGRTLLKKGLAGRDHWASHHVTVMIGKPVRAGVVGGLQPQSGEYVASAIDSVSGRAALDGGGDIPFAHTLGAMGKTLGAAVGIALPVLEANLGPGKVVTAALT